jgi:hypothetical protein
LFLYPSCKNDAGPELKYDFQTKMQILTFLWAFTALLLSGCGSPNDSQQNDFAQQQRASLGNVFFHGNSLPNPPTTEELNKTRDRVRAAQPWERSLLEELYPDDPELWVYATRDSDGDGLLDFRVSDYYGRFLEGDTDLDGDGIDNVLDTEPFNTATGKQERADIPLLADWSQQGKPAEMARIQRELFDQHRILLVERSAEFTPVLARSVYDVVTRVYRDLFAGNGTLPTLRIIATEESSLLDPEDEEGTSDFAQVLPASQTLEIYRRGIDAPAVIQLGYLAHEIAHNIQFSYDYDARRQDEIMRRNYFAATRFLELVGRYGWTPVDIELEPETEFTLFRPHYVVLEPYEYLYLEESVEAWEGWLAAIFAEVGEEKYLTDERITELNILGDYSLSGPWEWYSDFVIAYLYIEMLDSLSDRCPPAERAALGEAFQSETVAGDWPWFRFENARGAEVLSHLRDEYPLYSADASYLAEHYILTRHPGFCRSN